MNGKMVEIGDKFYRYEAQRFPVVVDADQEKYGVSRATLICREYFVSAETPKGHWIGYFPTSKNYWVSKTARKRHAYPTKEDAMEGYREQKLSFVRHSKVRLLRAEEDLALTLVKSENALFEILEVRRSE